MNEMGMPFYCGLIRNFPLMTKYLGKDLQKVRKFCVPPGRCMKDEVSTQLRERRSQPQRKW